MQSFQDRHGRQWQIDLTIGAVARVKKSSGGKFDLLNPSATVDGKELFALLDDDLATVYEVLWHIVEPQAERLGVTADAFGDGLAADVILAAQSVLFSEWLDFFRLLQRPDAAKALELMRAAKLKLMRAVAKRTDQIDTATLLAQLDRKIETAVGDSFGNLQASLDSTLGQ